MMPQRKPDCLAALAAVLTLAIAPALLGQDARAQATRAMAEGLPRVAAYKWRAFLESSPNPATRRAATLGLAEALLAIPDAAGALALFDRELPLPAARGDVDASFWRGQALAAAGRWSEALENYHAADPARNARARFGMGEALLALRRIDDAAAAFREVASDPSLGSLARLRLAGIALDAGQLEEADAALRGGGRADTHLGKEHSYLLGRLRLAQHDPTGAANIFGEALAQPQGLSERLVVGCHWGLAEAELVRGNLDAAEDALEALIEHYPHRGGDVRQPFFALDRTFAWLEALYTREPAPDLSVPKRWESDAAEPRRQAQAQLTVARLDARAGRTDRAEETFAAFGDRFPDSPLRARALIDLATLRLRLKHPATARLALDAARVLLDSPGGVPAQPGTEGSRRGPAPAAVWRTEIDVLDAEVALAQNDGAGAARRFQAVAEQLKSGPQAEAAAFNAVLAWLRATETERFQAAEAQFASRYPASPLNAEFPLEEGVALAARTPPEDTKTRKQAATAVRDYLRAAEGGARRAEARVALAELAFERPRPALSIAWRELAVPELRAVANDAPAEADGLVQRDRAAYLAIWLADAPGTPKDADHAIALAKKFLAERSDSALAAEARMKLGEIYYRRQDYPNALTQLELLAENAPDSPLAEPALYLAGLSAVLSASPAGLDKAVTLFSRAARHNGPFRLRAQLQLADVQNRLSRGRDALTLYDGVLAALRDEDVETRSAAMGGRGQTLISLAAAGGNDPNLLHDAVATLDGLANLPGVSLLWRRQALTLKGQALERLGDNDGALTAYNDALDGPEPAPPGATASTPPPEWTWFYRAGHLAAQLLEKQAQWEAAIAIYSKLATANGPMKTEFENTLSQRRLEHFVWSDGPAAP